MSLCLKVRKPQLLIPQFLTKRYYKMGRQAMEDTLVDLGGAQGSRAPSRTKNFLDGMHCLARLNKVEMSLCNHELSIVGIVVLCCRRYCWHYCWSQRQRLYGLFCMKPCYCVNIFTARKRSLGQGNIFTSICHSVHIWHGHPHHARPRADTTRCGQ